jgi:ABC-type branched-subunit amino acid transport system substrate-binding protein
MNKTAKWIVGVLVVILVIWAIAVRNKQTTQAPSTSNSNQTMNQTAGATYKVGVILPLTGDAASYGEPARNVYQMAVDEINASAGTNGNKLELVVEDGKCNGQDASNAMQKLVNVDKVQVVIGGFCSSESLAAEPIAESGKVAMISGGSSSPKLTGIGQYFMRDYPSDASQGSVLANVAFTKQSWKKVAVLQEQTDYAVGIYGAFSSAFQALGGTVTKEEFPTSATDFRSQLAKIKAANPDALFLDTQTPASAARILKQIQDLNWKPHLMLSDVTPPDTATVTQFKSLLESALGAEFGTDPSNAKFMHLSNAYKQKYNKDLPFASYAQTEYDAVYLVNEAIATGGYDSTKIAGWLRNVQNWDGASGKITIGSDGDRVGGHQPVIIINGVMQPLPK